MFYTFITNIHFLSNFEETNFSGTPPLKKLKKMEILKKSLSQPDWQPKMTKMHKKRGFQGVTRLPGLGPIPPK